MTFVRLVISIVTAGIALAVGGDQCAKAQVSSTRNVNSGTSDWFNASAWDNGVPSNPGDSALLLLAPRTNATLQLGSSITLEQLSIVGYHSINLAGAGPLLFRTDGVGELSINVTPQTGLLTTTISVPVSLSEGDALQVNVAASGMLQWNGAITSEAGDLIKQGDGILRLDGNNLLWGGELIVEGGSAVVLSNSALGNLDAGATIRSGSMLTLEQSSSEWLTFDSGTIHVRHITLSGPISLVGTGVIHRPRNPLITDRGVTFESSLGPTTISGSISGPGDLVLNNESRDQLNLTGTNSHTGHTYINAGQVFATNATSLGTGDGGTTIRGGRLILQAPTEERFRVEGGLLDFAAGDFVTPHPIAVAGGDVLFPNRPSIATPIVVDAPGGGINGRSSATSFTGGSTGAGNLRIANLTVDAPLAHDGELILDGVILNVANTFTGNTKLIDNATINHRNALGTATTAILVEEGSLTLNVIPVGDRGYIIKRGNLHVNVAGSINGPITLGGTFEASISGIGTFNGPIDYVTTPGGGRAHLASGTFNGPIRGTTELSIGGSSHSVVLNGASDLQGHTRIVNGTVIANHPHALNHASTHIETGTLEMNTTVSQPILMTVRTFGNESGTLRLNRAQEFNTPWVLHAGRIEPTVEVGMSRLILLGSEAPARVESSGGGSYRIDGELVSAGGGELAGKVKGDGDILLTGNTLNLSGDLSQFTGDFHVHNGTLNIGTALGFTAPHVLNPTSELHVYPGGTLSWANDTSSGEVVIANDIYLHNAHGSHGYRAALTRYGNGSHTLAGRIDVGDEGSTIDGSFAITGTLAGRNLTIRDNGLSIYSPQNQLRGVVRASGSGLGLSDNGEFHGLDAIILDRGGTLTFGPAADFDRLGDTTQIVSEGGHISLVSDRNATTGETLGNLHLKQGSTRIFVSSDHGSRPAALSIQTLTRDPGAILRFGQAGFLNSTRVLGGPTLEHGIIGPWAVTASGFATLATDGMVSTKTATAFSDINSAGSQNHVIVTGNQSLAADKSIASLQHNEDGTLRSLNLNGHELTVLSGGVFRSQEITNGRLTAGVSADAELVFHHGHRVSADIVDNAGGGSVALVVSSTGLRVSGNNSYTGGTWVVGTEYYTSKNATLTIESLSAIPANDRVYVDNGVYEMQPLSSGEVFLDELHLRNGGYVSGSFLAPLNVGQMFLEDGTINALLQGDGAIVKRTDGGVDFSNSRGDNFTGTVTVQDGVLSIQHRTLPQATFIVEGGQLDLTGDPGSSNNVVLKGGTLGAGYFNGMVDVQSDSAIFHNGFTIFRGMITGSGDLTIRGLQTVHDRYVGFFGDASGYSGDVRIESGSLRVGTPSNAGTGVITVEPSGQLILGADYYDDPPTVLANEIHLRGGRLYATPPWNGSLPGLASPTALSGEVFVHEEAFIGGIRLGVQNGAYLPALTFSGGLNLTNG